MTLSSPGFRPSAKRVGSGEQGICVQQGYGFRFRPLCSGAWITARMPQNCRSQGGSLPVHEHRRCYVVYEKSDEYMEAL